MKKLKRKVTVTVSLDQMKLEDQIKVLEPENAYLRQQLGQFRFAVQQCKEALQIVTDAMKTSNEWPQPGLNCDDEPITGGHIFRSVTCALETVAKAERGELKFDRESLHRIRTLQ